MIERALVTGAGGFVCRHIVDAMLDAGMSVIAVDLAFDDTLRIRWASRPVIFAQTGCDHLPDTAVDYVVHGAALTAGPEESGQTPIGNFRANVDAALNTLNWASFAGARRTVVISSSGVFRHSPEPILDEMTTPRGTGTYVAAKRSLELLVETLRAEYAWDALTVRLGSVYGQMEAARSTRPRVSRVLRLLREALSTGTMRVPLTGDRQDWTYAPDIGRAIVALLRSPNLKHDLYHVTSGEAFTEMEIAAAIRENLPDSTIQAIEAAPPPYRGAMTSTRLERDTGHARWTPFREGIAAVVAWARQDCERIL